jgi:hypothetical protein
MTAAHFDMAGRCPVHNVPAVREVRELPRQIAGHCPYCWRRVTWPAEPTAEELGARAGAAPSWTRDKLLVVHVR